MALVVFLRGVNVGGHRRFRPTVLAEELRHLDVVSIGATGTFVVRRRIGMRRLRDEIRSRLPFDAEVAIREGREVLDLVARNPFARRTVKPDMVPFVSVLARAPRAEPELPLILPARRGWLVKVLERHGPFALGIYRRHMKTIGCLGALDGAFGVPVTTRSWSTLERVAGVLCEGGPAPSGSGGKGRGDADRY